MNALYDWDKLETYFSEAVELEPAQQRIYLDQIQVKHPQLFKELCELLKNDARDDSILERPLITNGRALLSRYIEDSIDEELPEYIGQYRTLHPLGKGGMSVVYLAQQPAPLERKVALKILHNRHSSSEVSQRFQQERQMLGLMNHDYIAKAYEVGEQGDRPYLAMEYVEGMPITDYCQHHQLTIRERLQLFLKVCEAVNHAHQKGIIHRDIKPANILVNTQDGQHIPKLIDFGVAKSDGTLEFGYQTVTLTIIGTPAYMTPEQASGETADTRTDVYSLSILLYELVCGKLPIDPETLSQKKLPDAIKLICELDPPLPSNRVLGKTQFAQTCRSTPKAIHKQLTPDLDGIILKGLNKDPEDRYQGVLALADDIQRHLDNKPIKAIKQTYWLRFKKYTKRNRTLVTSLTAIALILVIGVAAIFSAYREATRANQQAEATIEALLSILQFTTPDKQGKDITILEAMQSLEMGIFSDFEPHPELYRYFLYIFGETYRMKGEYLAAEERLTQALEHKAKSNNLLKIYEELGLTLLYLTRFPDAASVFKSALIDLPELDKRDQLRLKSSQLYATMFNDPSQELLNELLDIHDQQRAILGTDHLETIMTGESIAQYHCRTKDHDKAVPLFLKNHKLKTVSFGESNPSTLRTFSNYISCLLHLGETETALKLCTNNLDQHRKLLGKDHASTTTVRYTLSLVHKRRGEYEEAITNLWLSIPEFQKYYGEFNLRTLNAYTVIGDTYLSNHQFQEAMHWFSHSLDVFRNIPYANPAIQTDLRAKQAFALTKMGFYADAQELIEALLINHNFIPYTRDRLNFHLALCKEKMNDPTKALYLYEEIANSVSSSPHFKHKAQKNAKTLCEPYTSHKDSFPRLVSNSSDQIKAMSQRR